jgi:hypothetical protein
MISQQNGDRTIRPGAIFVKKGTLLPEPLRLENDATATGWAPIASDSDGRPLEKKLAGAGWTFFYMAGAIKTTAFGFEKSRMIHRALKRLFTTVTLQKCNCIEIDDVATHTFLGIPYVSVSAHARHIQKGMVFSGE